MPNLKFPKADVRELFDHARTATEHAASLGEEGRPAPALWLVGDEGVYLMSNGRPGFRDESGKNRVVYAKGINPNVDPFDRWWERKRAAFGGDDGVESLPLDALKPALDTPGDWLTLKVTKTSISVLY